jgi:hypothetical protein
MADTRSNSAGTTATKKPKGKKPTGPVDIGKELQQAISNIESKQAGNREQDQEIG